MGSRIADRLQARSTKLIVALEQELRRVVLLWVLFASFLCGLRMAFSATPIIGAGGLMSNALSYILAVGAPVASLLVALHLFPAGASHAQPKIRLARFGRWRTLDQIPREMPLYGPAGLMASLLVGMLLNVPVRTLEFLSAIPALGATPPAWLATLFGMMLLDVVLVSSLYVIAFVMALRVVPLFPRFLLLVWGADILLQIAIADVMGRIGTLPPEVAGALGSLLEGNLKKVLISLALWLPYLLLSRRVNLTYRHRVPA